MKLEVDPPYSPVTEMPYCCVPAVLQMIQKRRGLEYQSQEETGYQFGLIVPAEIKHRFTEVRVGPEPRAGYGTQTSREKFSIPNYFRKNDLPLKLTKWHTTNTHELRACLVESLSDGDDVIVCYNSQLLLGYGDIEHVSLVQSFDTSSEHILLVDPAAGAPKHRKVDLEKLFEVFTTHDVSGKAGLWVISSL